MQVEWGGLERRGRSWVAVGDLELRGKQGLDVLVWPLHTVGLGLDLGEQGLSVRGWGQKHAPESRLECRSGSPA
jgi:hypothetical protein